MFACGLRLDWDMRGQGQLLGCAHRFHFWCLSAFPTDWSDTESKGIFIFFLIVGLDICFSPPVPCASPCNFPWGCVLSPHWKVLVGTVQQDAPTSSQEETAQTFRFLSPLRSQREGCKEAEWPLLTAWFGSSPMSTTRD